MSQRVKLSLKVEKNLFLESARRKGFRVKNGRITGQGLFAPIYVDDNGYVKYDNMDTEKLTGIVADYLSNFVNGIVEQKENTIFIQL